MYMKSYDELTTNLLRIMIFFAKNQASGLFGNVTHLFPRSTPPYYFCNVLCIVVIIK